MTTISFSVEDDLKRDIARIARRTKKSKSAVFRDVMTTYKFTEQLSVFQDKTAQVLSKLGITSEDELLEYLEGSDTYASRV